jgi:hypothetical protein
MVCGCARPSYDFVQMNRLQRCTPGQISRFLLNRRWRVATFSRGSPGHGQVPGQQPVLVAWVVATIHHRQATRSINMPDTCRNGLSALWLAGPACSVQAGSGKKSNSFCWRGYGSRRWWHARRTKVVRSLMQFHWPGPGPSLKLGRGRKCCWRSSCLRASSLCACRA